MTDTVDTAVSPGYFRGRDIRSLAADLRSGRTTSVELVEHSLAAITRLDPILNAFTTVDTEGALAAARTADRERAEGRDRGVLHGIPVSVKDLIDIAGQVTTSGSLAHPRRPETDAECVSRLRAAGAVIVGKNVLHEFAYGATGDRSAHGASRNPWDVNRISGGSSGGSAVATAAGMVPVAVGTDTAGSVRVPAALCGVTGFKPAHGDIPRRACTRSRRHSITWASSPPRRAVWQTPTRSCPVTRRAVRRPSLAWRGSTRPGSDRAIQRLPSPRATPWMPRASPSKPPRGSPSRQVRRSRC
ncbi:amidase [Mycolicibacterium mageritense]|uniref:amidase n=1 Tax=Mycolicibacterium mageritense TaxID=53462 RepID=UPI001E5679CA|nr:amidase [Mycolicibacterium mageritense]MCC9184615.1 amidase [Mycolicibacterium mageritense]